MSLGQSKAGWKLLQSRRHLICLNVVLTNILTVPARVSGRRNAEKLLQNKLGLRL